MLLDAAGQANDRVSATVSRSHGTVNWFSDIRGYGFINADDGQSLFVHYKGISGSEFRRLESGDRVAFTPVTTEKGVQAVDVEMVAAIEPSIYD